MWERGGAGRIKDRATGRGDRGDRWHEEHGEGISVIIELSRDRKPREKGE